MQGDSSRPDEQSLVEHRGFVEALARRLVFDQHLADDLVQETLLAAMRNPPRERKAMRGWLARVVRNLAYRSLRTRERRRRRERRVARPEATPPTGDLVARLAWHRTVVDAVLALPDETRQTLMLRFYEDLTPKEIAKRQGIPSATVRSRLKRGLAMMRERLDAECGGRRAWTLGLIPLLFPSQTVAAATGGALMGVAAMSAQKNTILVAAALLALVGTFVVGRFVLDSGEAPTERTTHRAAVLPDADYVPDKAAAPAVDPSAPMREVFVKDRFDAPIAGATVEVLRTVPYPERGPWLPNDIPMRRWLQRSAGDTVLGTFRTDEQGRAEIRGVPVQSIDLRASKASYAAQTLWVWRQQGAITLRLHVGTPLRGRVLDQHNAPVPGAVVFAGAVRAQGNFGADPRPVRVVADAQGRYVFPALPAADRSLWAAFPGGTAVYCASLRFPGAEVFDIRLRGGGTLAGQVTDIETGTPVEGVAVTVMGRGLPVAFYGHAITDTAGRYRIKNMPTGHIRKILLEKRGWAQVYEQLENAVELRVGETATLDGKVHRGGTIRGRVLRAGDPVPGAGVASMFQAAIGGIVVRNAMTDEDGRFELRDLPVGNHVLGVSKLGYSDGRKPSDMFGLKDKTDHPLVVALGRGAEVERNIHVTRGTITIEGVVIGPDGKGFAGAKVAVAGVSVPTGADGSFKLEHVRGKKSGPTYISVHAKGHVLRGAKPSVPVGVVHARNLRIELTVPPVVTGTVRDSSGTLPRNIAVLLARPSDKNLRGAMEYRAKRHMWEQAQRAKLDKSGRFEIPLPPGKKFLLRAVAPERATTEPVAINVEPNRQRYEIDLTLDAGHALSGTTAPGAHVVVRRELTGMDKSYAFMMGDTAPPIAAIADAEGAFRVDHLGGGRWEVEVSLPGFAKLGELIDLPQSRALRLVPERLVSIGGTIVFADGAPVAGATLHAWELEENGKMVLGQGSQHRIRADAHGRWRKDGLRPGRFQLSVSGTIEANVVRHSDDSVRGGQTNLRIVVRRGERLRGRIVDANGVGVPGVKILVQEAVGNTLHLRSQGESGADGGFDLVGVPVGTHDLRLSHGKKHHMVTGVKAGSDNLRITFDPTRDDLGRGDVRPFSGRLLDEAGKPMSGRYLTIARADGRAIGGRTMTKTDADGRFAYTVAAARYRLTMRRPGELGAPQHVPNLGVFDAAKGLVIRARRGLSIRGSVKGADGAPVADVYVRVKVSPMNAVVVRTDANGRFDLGGLARGEHCEVSVWRKHFVTDVTKDVAAGTHDVQLVLRKGLEARGVVRDEQGRPLMKRSLRFIWLEDETRRTLAKTDKSGAFHVQGLLPGRYRVSARHPERGYLPCGELNAGAVGVKLRVKSP